MNTDTERHHPYSVQRASGDQRFLTWTLLPDKYKALWWLYATAAAVHDSHTLAQYFLKTFAEERLDGYDAPVDRAVTFSLAARQS